MTPDAAARLAPRLRALFALHRPDAAQALTEAALQRAAGLPDETPAEQIHALVRALLAAEPATAATATEAELDALDAAPDPALRQRLRVGLARLGTDPARLLLGYYGFGADGDSAAARRQRRGQLAERFGLSREALRHRALAIREQLEADVGGAP